MAASIPVWTWDVSRRAVDLEGTTEALVPLLQTILEGGLWKQFRKFPPATLARLLPHLEVPPNTRRLIEIWIEETPRRVKAQG
jgi:hypothetical protein